MNEYNAFNQEEYEPKVLSPNESHMACLLLLDKSGSMVDEPIKQLNQALNQFKKTVCEDPQTRERVDIAIVAFNDESELIQKFVPITDMKEGIQLKAGGGTDMTKAFRMAIPMVTERRKILQLSGAVPYKPWIVLISDGMDENISEISRELASLRKDKKMKVIALGVEGFDSETLHELAPESVIKLEGYDFSQFFDWLHKSFVNISVTSPGEHVQGVPLSENLEIDPKKDTTNMLNS